MSVRCWSAALGGRDSNSVHCVAHASETPEKKSGFRHRLRTRKISRNHNEYVVFLRIFATIGSSGFREQFLGPALAIELSPTQPCKGAALCPAPGGGPLPGFL